MGRVDGGALLGVLEESGGIGFLAYVKDRLALADLSRWLTPRVG
jgi:hypothetical protein